MGQRVVSMEMILNVGLELKEIEKRAAVLLRKIHLDL